MLRRTRRGPACKQAAPELIPLSRKVHHENVEGIETPPQEKLSRSTTPNIVPNAAFPLIANHTIPRLTVRKQGQKPSEVPFKHPCTTGWCLYKSPITESRRLSDRFPTTKHELTCNCFQGKSLPSYRPDRDKDEGRLAGLIPSKKKNKLSLQHHNAQQFSSL